MGRKVRKTVGVKPPARAAGESVPLATPSGEQGEASSIELAPAVLDSESSEVRKVLVAPAVAPPLPPLSPLQQSQQLELGIGLGVLGAAVGALAGYSNAPIYAPAGNLVAAIEGCALGLFIAHSLARTLFLNVRTQWMLWVVLGVLTYGGDRVGGLGLAAVGALIGTLTVVFGPFQRHAAKPGPEPASLPVQGASVKATGK